MYKRSWIKLKIRKSIVNEALKVSLIGDQIAVSLTMCSDDAVDILLICVFTLPGISVGEIRVSFKYLIIHNALHTHSQVYCKNIPNKNVTSHELIHISIGHVNEYPTLHYFGNPRHTQSIIA